MRVVVTGATGHLGRSVVAELTRRGHEVLGHSSQTDLTKDDSIAVLAAQLDGAVLVHLAGWLPPNTAATTVADRRRLLEVNCFGAMRALEAARGRARCVVYASTFEVYGLPESNLIDEDHPTRPLNDYAATKLAGEDHLIAFGAEERIRVVALRLPAIYGPGETAARVLPNCLARVARGERPIIAGDGGDLRDQIHVDDAARGVALAIEGDAEGIFNLADGEPHSVVEIAATALRVAGMTGGPQVVARAKPRLDYHMNIGRARRALGFTPLISLEEGMRRQFEWMRNPGQ